MKKTKVIIPALGILLLSTAASVTGTVAWFSMNAEVTANGMQVKAKAEDGIVISNEAKAEWKNTATASHNGSGVELIPTSTAKGTSWYHATSTDADDAAAGQAAANYGEPLNITVTDGVGSKDANSYYLVNSFFISSSSAQALTKDLYVKSLTATVDTSYSGALDKAVRVLVSDASGTNALIFNPLGGTDSYKVAGTTDVTTETGADEAELLDNISIPAYTGTSGLEIKVFAYFEGEDEDCKSTNIKANLDAINVSIVFEAKTHA